MSWSSSRHGQGQISTMLMKKPMLRVQSERKLNFSDYQVRENSKESIRPFWDLQNGLKVYGRKLNHLLT